MKLPGTKKFVLLQNKGLIPIGTIIDARKGRVHIVSSDGKGGTRHVDFFEGMFKLRQGKATRGYTDAKLVGPLACGKGRATAARKGRRGRHLWGKGKGHHSSTGKNSSGSVRGTWWLVWDRCDGSTLTFVKRGEVLVRDFRTGRKVLLHKGQSYVAGPKRKHNTECEAASRSAQVRWMRCFAAASISAASVGASASSPFRVSAGTASSDSGSTAETVASLT